MVVNIPPTFSWANNGLGTKGAPACTNPTTEGLTANMGKELKDLIDALVLSTGTNTECSCLEMTVFF